MSENENVIVQKETATQTKSNSKKESKAKVIKKAAPSTEVSSLNGNHTEEEKKPKEAAPAKAKKVTVKADKPTAAPKKAAAKPATKKVTEATATKAPKKAAAKKTPTPKKAATTVVDKPVKESKVELPASVEAHVIKAVEDPKPVEAPVAKVEAPVIKAEEPVKQPAPTKKRTTATKSLRHVAFQLKFHTQPGQSLYVTGNHPLLGNGNYEEALPLSYLNENYWLGTIDLTANGSTITEPITYNYILKNIDGSISVDWGNDKVIEPTGYQAEELLLLDTWNASSLVENVFYTEPFQEVLLKQNFTPVEATKPANTTHIFRAKAPLLAKGETVCIVGSITQLGEWDTEQPLVLSRQEGETWYSASLDLSDTAFPVSYKYGIYDTVNNKFLRFEDGDNRVVYDLGSVDKLTVVSDGFVNMPYHAFKGAGIAIPVFSLRSEKSFGVGEFTDLKLLIDWAKQTGLKLIQLLPVNDTTATHQYTDSYPYAAISAFALHPQYLHLPAIVNKQNHDLLTDLEEKRIELNSKTDIDYVEVMATKWDLLKQIFPSQKEATFKSGDFHTFFQENAHWLVPYAAFCYFREKYKTSDFSAWKTNSTFNAEEINSIASSPLKADDALSIYYYVQYHLHLQLRDATNYAHANGIIVKGDIPIGIYRNSCDAWQQPELYNMDMQAGAPPDDFAIKGQNWGFPTYNWQRMREDGFMWWKRRFQQMSYYFDAFRIDHILGFFRIWSIPMDAVEGIMGHFVPALPVHINEFGSRGMTVDYIRFCKPYITDAVLQEVFGAEAPYVKTEFLQAHEHGHYSMLPDFDTQRKVEAHFAALDKNDEYDHQIRQGLYDLISNVLLFEVEGSQGQQYHFRIGMDTTSSFRHLDHHTQGILKDLYLNYFYRRQDAFWAREAMLKLPELKRSTNMLICGEDLGMVPDSVPGVMKDLAILSLEIQRMPKDPKRQFFHPNDAPYLSVVTPSTHDMSTIRGWWEEDRATTQKFYNHELGQWGNASYFCEPWVARIILAQHFHSPAMWSIFQLQDLLSISEKLRRENPHEERINIPADPKHYWRYRMHVSLEDLLTETDFNHEITRMVELSGR